MMFFLRSYKTSTTVEGLQPDTEYEVRVQVRLPMFTLGGAFSAPYHITTQPEGTMLSYVYVISYSCVLYSCQKGDIV